MEDSGYEPQPIRGSDRLAIGLVGIGTFIVMAIVIAGFVATLDVRWQALALATCLPPSVMLFRSVRVASWKRMVFASGLLSICALGWSIAALIVIRSR
jgi:hypothetical protein